MTSKPYLLHKMDYRKWSTLASSYVHRRIYVTLVDAIHALVARRLNAILRDTAVVYSIDNDMVYVHTLDGSPLDPSIQAVIKSEV